MTSFFLYFKVSNVLMAINAKYPILKKVSLNRINNARRSAFMYIGPKISINENEPLNFNYDATILKLPTYRKKHLLSNILFDHGEMLGVFPTKKDGKLATVSSIFFKVQHLDFTSRFKIYYVMFKFLVHCVFESS